MYQQNVDTTAFHLARLEFTGNMQAGQFNMSNTQPQFFRNVYGTDYNQVVPVNLWRPQPAVATTIAFRCPAAAPGFAPLVSRPESESRFSRCRSVRISEACW